MHVKIKLSQFKRAVEKLSPFVAKGSHGLPILRHIRLTAEIGKQGKLNLEATDLELGCLWDIDAQVLEAGSVCVDHKPLLTFLRLIKKIAPEEEIELSIREHYNEPYLNIASLSGSFYEMEIKGAKAEEMPSLPTQEGSSARMLISAQGIKAMGTHLAKAVAPDDTRPVLTQINIVLLGNGGSHATATDGARLHRLDSSQEILHSHTAEAPQELLVQARMLRAAASCLSPHEPPMQLRASFTPIRTYRKLSAGAKPRARIYGWEPTNIFIILEECIIMSRAIPGHFPQRIEEVVEMGREEASYIPVNREDLLKALRQAKLLGEIVRFALYAGNDMRIEPIPTFYGEDHRKPSWYIQNTAPAKGDPTASVYNVQYALQAAEGIGREDGEIMLRIPKMETKMAGWREERQSPLGSLQMMGSGGLLALVMPMSVR